jgi:Ca2+-binding RTX toxin-like protein
MAGDGGADSLSGAEVNDLLFGGAGADSLSAGEGNDTLYGDAGADTLAGGAGDDLYAVDSAQDVIQVSGLVTGGRDAAMTALSWTLGTGLEDLTLTTWGQSGTGNGLANRISGSPGADTLEGASGADQLSGGSSADVFLYSGRLDSGTTAGLRDRILDFSRSQGDRIDLSGLDANEGADGNNAFTSFGQAGGAEPGAGSMRWVQQNGVTLVHAYLDSVAGADMVIEVVGMGSAQAGDFIY